MPTLLEQIARQRAQQAATKRAFARSPVSVYSPGRNVQQTVNPPRQPQPRSQLDQMVQAFSSTPEAQQKVQKEVEAKAAADRPLWGKGLGLVFGNPIARAAFSGLEYLSYPRRALTVGLEELTKITPEWAEWGLNKMIDEDASEGRSAWERINDPEYGFGSIIDQGSNEGGRQWLNRALGFTGDVVLDPLTYITGGATKVVQGAKSASASSRAAQAAQLADNAAAIAARGGADDVGRQGAAFARMTAERAKEAADEATRLYDVRTGVPARANRAGRVAEIGELSRTNPELFDEFAAEIQQIAQRGYSAARSAPVRQALGLEEPALRLAGARIPGSAPLARGVQAAGGAVRGRLNASPLLGLSRGSRGMEQEIAELVGGKLQGGADEILQAATKVGMRNISREGRQVDLAGNMILGKLTRESLGKLSPVERAALVKEAETSGTRNALNSFFDEMANIYEGVAGRKVRRLGGTSETYVPHMLTPRFRRFLASGGKGADDFMRAAGFKSEDLLEGSGYLEKARQLTPGKKIKLNDREITIGDGTIDDLNTRLREAFPEFDGKFYEDDPIRIGEAYVSSLSKGAGAERAKQAFAKSGNPFAVEVTGDLEYKLNRYNEALQGQEPAFDALQRGAPAADFRGGVLPERQPVPESEFFAPAVDRAQTASRQEWLLGPGAERAAAMRQARKGSFEELVEEVKAGRERLKRELLDVAERREPPIAPRIQQARLKALERKLTRLEAEDSLDQKELAEFMVQSRLQIASLEEDLAKMQRSWARKVTLQQRKAASRVEEQIERVRQWEQRALTLAGDPAQMDNVVSRRMEELYRGVTRAEAALEAKKNQFPPPHSPEAVASARHYLNRTMKREGFEPEPLTNRSYTTFLNPEGQEERLTLKRARRILQEDRDWQANVKRQTAQERQALELQKVLASRQRSKGRVQVGEFAFPESETEEATLQAARISRGEMERISKRAREVEEQEVFRKDAARAAARVATEAQRDEALAPLKTELAAATGAQKQMLQDTMDRLMVLNADINATRAQVWANREVLADVRQRQLDMTQAIRQYKRLEGGMSKAKVRNVDDLIKVALEPIEKVARTNPNLTDDALNQTEALLHDAAARIYELAETDLGQRSADNIIEQARNGKLAKVMLATVNDTWKLQHSGNRVVAGDILVQAELHRRMQNLYELQKQPGLLGRTLNAFTNLFKTYATLSPGFHVRNAMSAVFMNASDGVSLRAQLDAVGLWRQYREGGETWLAKQSEDVQNAFTAIAATGAGGRFTEAGVAETIDATKRGAAVYNRLASNRVTRKSQEWGSNVEGSVRLGMALDSMRKGETLSGAIQRISRVHFDYADVSKLDETAKRMIPFWTFMSRNMPLQVSQMWSKPRAYQVYANLTRNFSVGDEPNTPGYWKDAGAFNTGLKIPENNLPILGAASGLPLYLQPDLGFTRLQQDVGDVEDALSGENPGGILSSFNPFFTAPAEYVTRQDFYTGQQFPEGEGFEEAGGVLGLPIRLAAMMTGNTNEAGQVDPRFMNALSAINPLQGRAERLTPQLTGGDDEAKRRQFESIARFLGLPVRTLTPRQQDSEYLRRYYEAIEEMRRQQQLATAS